MTRALLLGLLLALQSGVAIGQSVDPYFDTGTTPPTRALVNGIVDGGGILRWLKGSTAGHTLVDLFDGSGTATVVKAASTAPVATDPALVVVLSPNGAQATAALQTTMDGHITSTQPRKMQDGAGNALTSQTNGVARALDVGIDVSGVQVDPRQIRALTSSDVVTANQGTATTLPGAWPTKVTDGTHTMPTMDAPARAGAVEWTDGTNTAAVKAASTAPVAADPAGVVSLSPNGRRTEPSYNGAKTRFLDMNVANGGVARATGVTSTSTYTTVFLYTGSGYLFSFLVGLEGNLIGADEWNVKLEIDGAIVFEVATSDLGTSTIYDLISQGDEDTAGFSLISNIVTFASPRGGALYFGSSVKVSVKKATSTTSRQFRAGAVYLSKET